MHVSNIILSVSMEWREGEGPASRNFWEFSVRFRGIARAKNRMLTNSAPICVEGEGWTLKKPPFPGDFSEVTREGDRFETGLSKLELDPPLLTEVTK